MRSDITSLLLEYETDGLNEADTIELFQYPIIDTGNGVVTTALGSIALLGQS